ncbi:MAG: hydroxyethylthiazole kinase [Candidatus Atribacteria bacterium]|nr:hydroxyethylthiazole kinase [Candidatus Atribacteria bacterium]
MDKKIVQQCALLLPIIRQKKPLIHHITNMVTANDNANVVLAIGASPVMALSKFEVEEMAAQADSLVLNLGTLSPDLVESCRLAGKVANKKGIPVILDPVGVGATRFRTNAAKEILSEIDVTIIRGNVGEVSALLGDSRFIKGVDAKSTNISISDLARKASQCYGTIVAVTGKVDVVSNGIEVFLVYNGHPLLKVLTGTGCMASSLCATFASVETDHLTSTIAALGFFGVCAEIAARKVEGPGLFHQVLFDVIYNMDVQTLASSLHIEVKS